ncbi:MAG: M3 family metallopeptidase [Gemmatimonadales bacterium]
MTPRRPPTARWPVRLTPWWSVWAAFGGVPLSAQTTPPATPPAATYRLDYRRNFFDSPAAEGLDRRALGAMLDTLTTLVPRFSHSAVALEQGLRLADRLDAALVRHDTYLKLRVADSTLDDASREARAALSARVGPVLDGEQRALATIDPKTLERFVRRRPGLAGYRFAIAEARRTAGRRSTPAVDSVLGALEPVATGWQEELYQRLLARTSWGTVQTAAGARDVFQQSGALQADPDSSVRAEARRRLDQGYQSQRELYAFSLVATVRARSAVARLRGYPDAPAAVYASRALVPDSVRAMIARVRAHAGLAKRYLLDRRRTAGRSAPAVSLDSALAAIRAALAVLGPEYARELASLTDPANGRLDIGPGPSRQATGFSWESPDRATGVYLYRWDGQVGDISRLAHEAGHAMHRRLMSLAGVPRTYAGGPLLAEPAAQFDELLVTDYLARTSTDPALRTAALARFIDVGLDAVYGAQDADLEQQIYDSVAAGSVRTADDLDRITARVDSAYSVPLEGDAAGHRWMRVRLMWEDPLYLSNYMYSGMLAVAYFARYASDSSRFVPAYLSLLRGGWPAPADALLRRHLGIRLEDPALVSEAFGVLERKVEELEAWTGGTGPRASPPTDGTR